MLQEAYGRMNNRAETGDTTVHLEGDEVSVVYNDDVYIFGGAVEVQWSISPYEPATYDNPEAGGDFDVESSEIVSQVPTLIFSQKEDRIVTPQDIGEALYRTLMDILERLALRYAELYVDGKETQNVAYTQLRTFQNVFPGKEDQSRLQAASKEDYMSQFSGDVKEIFGDLPFDL